MRLNLIWGNHRPNPPPSGCWASLWLRAPRRRGSGVQIQPRLARTEPKPQGLGAGGDPLTPLPGPPEAPLGTRGTRAGHGDTPRAPADVPAGCRFHPSSRGMRMGDNFSQPPPLQPTRWHPGPEGDSVTPRGLRQEQCHGPPGRGGIGVHGDGGGGVWLWGCCRPRPLGAGWGGGLVAPVVLSTLGCSLQLGARPWLSPQVPRSLAAVPLLGKGDAVVALGSDGGNSAPGTRAQKNQTGGAGMWSLVLVALGCGHWYQCCRPS